MAAFAEKLLNLRLFQRPGHFESSRQIVFWWEKRRFAYNVIVGTTGVFTCAIMLGLAVFSQRRFGVPMGLSGSPIFEIIAIFLYGIAANVCYTCGWMVELFARAAWKERAEHFGAISFALGIFLSMAVTLAPALICAAAVLLKLF